MEVSPYRFVKDCKAIWRPRSANREPQVRTITLGSSEQFMVSLKVRALQQECYPSNKRALRIRAYDSIPY